MTWKELIAAAMAAGVEPDDKIGFLHIYPLAAREPNVKELDIHRDAGYVTISLMWQSGAVHGHKFEDASIKPMGKK